MSKIQILNEKQIEHFVAVLSPELERPFNKKAKELKEQAKKEKDNFVTHTEVIELKKKQSDKIEKIKSLSNILRQLKEVDKDYKISANRCFGDSEIIEYTEKLISDDSALDELQKEYSEKVDELLINLSIKNLNVDYEYSRRQTMIEELRAKLCMTAVIDFEKIKEVILESIDINSFFTNPIL